MLLLFSVFVFSVLLLSESGGSTGLFNEFGDTGRFDGPEFVLGSELRKSLLNSYAGTAFWLELPVPTG